MPFESFTVKKEITKNTLSSYKSRLNRLATAGYSTVDSLVNNQDDIIQIVKDSGGDSDPERHKKRIFMSAIFYALSDLDNSHKKKYHAYFQTIYPSKNVDGDPWKSKEQYAKDKDSDKERRMAAKVKLITDTKE
jgi:hypothetical protein